MTISRFNGLYKINNILIDFSRDIWTYIVWTILNNRKKGEVGSSEYTK